MTREEERNQAALNYIMSDYALNVGEKLAVRDFTAGAEWADKTMLDKACKWLEDNLYDYAGEDDKRNIVPFDKSIFEDFKTYMKGE